MAANIIQYEPEARDSLLQGINKLANAVKTTLGPRGRNVIIGRSSGIPVITQHGGYIANVLELTDPMENLGVQVLRNIADLTNDVSGDGTTTSIILAQSIIESGDERIRAGISATDLIIGLETAKKAVISHLESQSNAIDSEHEIRQVATIAVNNDSELADLIVSGFEKGGRDGTILVESANSRQSSVEIKSGMHFNNGALTEVESETILDNVLILLTDEKITDKSQLTRILEQVKPTNRHLIIMAGEFDENVLSWLEAVNSRNVKTIIAVKAPGMGDRQIAILNDIAIYTGATVISVRVGYSLDNAHLSILGQANQVYLNEHSLDIIKGSGAQSDVNARIYQIKRMIEQATTEEDRKELQLRLENLANGVAIISVGGSSEQVMHQRKELVQNALVATRLAFAKGVVPGGGVAYIRAQQSLNKLSSQQPDFAAAIDIVRLALEAPLRSIAENADEDPDFVVKKVQDGQGGFGFNAQTRTYENLEAAGILDPVKVLQTTLENAVHFACLVLTTDVCISEQQ